MKKTVFSFAIAVVAAALVSCGNKTAQGDAQDSAAVESTEQVEEQEVPIDQLTELSCDAYTAKVPEGFKARSRMVNYSCNMGFKEAPFTTAAFNCDPYTSIEKWKEDMVKQGAQPLDDITANGNTFSVFFKLDTRDDKQNFYTATPKGEGVMTIKAYEGAHQMDKAEAKEVIKAQMQILADNVTLK